MTSRSFRHLLGCALVATLPLAACTSTTRPIPTTASPAMRLVAFDSCAELLTDLRKAARAEVGPYGFGNGMMRAHDMAGGARNAMPEAQAQAAAPADAGAPAFSGTNNHEQGADEPDLVKTDGKRIVTVLNGVLRVVDAATRKETGRLSLEPSTGQAQLLISGDHALVLQSGNMIYDDFWDPGNPKMKGPEILLVDLTGTPKVLSTYRTEGEVVDARLSNGTARVVLRTSPRFAFKDIPGITDEGKRIAANQQVVDEATSEAWLPSYEVTTGGSSVKGQVGCDRVSRPTTFSGKSMVSVLSFDMAATALSDGDPVTVVADGDTVYGTGSTLYLTNDERWRFNGWRGGSSSTAPARTEIHRFDASGRGRPAYVASGAVPGWLINQYALSEWQGDLRIATTSGLDGSRAGTESAIRVLRQRGTDLAEIGAVEGLGKGERIYSVRYIGPRGYVVTFKQTDPLYSVDLSDPAKPTVTGELKITGYSSHLQPAGDGRLIGIGQEADKNGRTQGTQVSLFDVADPANPKRLAQYHVESGHSGAEHDPHALLYWPATGLFVVPMDVYDPAVKPAGPKATALALKITETGITQAGSIAQPVVGPRGTPSSVLRSLVIGDVLWTVSHSGLQASNLSTLDTLGWLPTA
jgi:uncharacterized secreted protein with C-terminal beta-propeller domain